MSLGWLLPPVCEYMLPKLGVRLPARIGHEALLRLSNDVLWNAMIQREEVNQCRTGFPRRWFPVCD
jgi:hypothetical protein